jgi:hypothetical protein
MGDIRKMPNFNVLSGTDLNCKRGTTSTKRNGLTTLVGKLENMKLVGIA